MILTQVLQVFGIIVGWLYYTILESSKLQATIGKMALGLVVTDLAGNRISFLAEPMGAISPSSSQRFLSDSGLSWLALPHKNKACTIKFPTALS